MAKDTLLSVIEDLLEADQNAINKKNFKTDQEKMKTSPDTQGVLGTEKGAALDAGGDKDVGGKKGDNASDASPDTQGVLGKTKGAALDAGGDKDVGKLKEAEGDPDGVLGKGTKGAALDAGGDKDVGKLKEEEEEVAEESQEPSNKKNQVVDQEKQKTSPDTQGVLGKDGQALDAGGDKDVGGKKPVEEGKDEDGDGMPDDEEADTNGDGEHDEKDHEPVSEGEMPPALKKAQDKDDDEESDDEDDEDEEESDDEEEGDEEEGDEEEDPEAETEPESDDEVKEELTAKQKKLDKDGDGKIDGDDLAAVRNEEEEMDDDEGLEEDFKEKATIIFETAVNHKAQMIREEIEAEYNTKLSEEVEQMNAKISEFVDYAVKEWLKENQLEIKYSLRTEIAENFIKGLKNLFTESYIEIPEEDVSVVDELTETVESYKEQIEEQTTALEEARQELLSLKRAGIVDELAEDLTETQKIRLEKLSESVEAADIDEFRYKVDQLKESFFSNESEQNPLLGSLSEEVFGGTQSIEEDTSVVSQYAKFLSKTVLK